MEPADYMKITMSVEEAQKILPNGTMDRVRADNIATSIQCGNFTPAQAQAALVLAWNRILSHARFSLQDMDYPAKVD